jgi:uncharacterized protein (TIGR02597 family)
MICRIVLCYLWFNCMMITASAQTTAYSEVGGFDTIPITGTAGGRSRVTVVATQFVQANKYTGYASVEELDALHDASASWLDDAFNAEAGSHYVEIVSVNGSRTAPGVGLTRTISDTMAASKRLVLDADLPFGLAAPVEYRVIRHWTLGTIFGVTNAAGLQGGSAVSADLVKLWNGSNHDSYYYQTTGIGGVGWRKVGDQTSDASNTVIRPDQSMMVLRVAAPTLPLVMNGWVKIGQASIEVGSGFNFLPNPFSEAMTLGNCGLFTGDPLTGIASGGSTGADQVMLWNGTGYDTYFYQSGGLGGGGWRKVGAQSVDASSTKIQPGSSLILKRQLAEGFTWTIPQP